MPLSQPYYLNAPSLASATSVFSDAALTICAPDGFYSDGSIVREMVGCVLLPQQVCAECCSDLCSGWTATSSPATLGATIGWYDCTTMSYNEQFYSAPFDESLCVMYGTTPEVKDGDAILTQQYTCGCCAPDTCVAWSLTITGLGSSAEVYYRDCEGNYVTETFFNSTTICSYSKFSPQIISGSGILKFRNCEDCNP